MNILLLLLFLLTYLATASAGIEDHYRKIENKICSLGIRNVDQVYMINLDKRPERWANCMTLLNPFGIYPQRFPGIYGWSLPVEVLTDIGLKFEHGMWSGREYVMHFPPELNGKYLFVPLTGDSYGKTFFSGWTVVGTIGCSLSHLSVLKDAYDSDYETVWIMEDDIAIVDNPHKLSLLIEELDSLVGVDGWDALYTDFDYLVVDESRDVASQIPLMWRPDMPYLNMDFLAEHRDVGENFMKIGSRMRAHSIIYRRCGIKKILDFYRARGNFLPYDQEIALIPGIKLFVVKHSVVSVHEVTSDTRYKQFN